MPFCWFLPLHFVSLFHHHTLQFIHISIYIWCNRGCCDELNELFLGSWRSLGPLQKLRKHTVVLWFGYVMTFLHLEMTRFKKSTTEILYLWLFCFFQMFIPGCWKRSSNRLLYLRFRRRNVFSALAIEQSARCHSRGVKYRCFVMSLLSSHTDMEVTAFCQYEKIKASAQCDLVYKATKSQEGWSSGLGGGDHAPCETKCHLPFPKPFLKLVCE